MDAAKNITKMEGWSTLEIDDEGIKKTQENQKAEAKAIASRIHRVFVQNDDGAKVLEDLIAMTLLRATVTPQATQFEAGINEGRADIVRQILQNIEIAERE